MRKANQPGFAGRPSLPSHDGYLGHLPLEKKPIFGAYTLNGLPPSENILSCHALPWCPALSSIQIQVLQGNILICTMNIWMGSLTTEVVTWPQLPARFHSFSLGGFRKTCKKGDDCAVVIFANFFVFRVLLFINSDGKGGNWF